MIQQLFAGAMSNPISFLPSINVNFSWFMTLKEDTHCILKESQAKTLIPIPVHLSAPPKISRCLNMPTRNKQFQEFDKATVLPKSLYWVFKRRCGPSLDRIKLQVAYNISTTLEAVKNNHSLNH